jgi:membrane protease YdiL (CAAX protease family)
MSIHTSASRRSPWTFILLVFVLSVPFWLVGHTADQLLQKAIPIDLPLSALQAVNPLIAASILVYGENGSDGVKRLLKRAVDYGRIKRKVWYVPILFLWPTTMVLAYGSMYLMGAPLPDDPRLPMLIVPLLFVVFLLSAAFEQVGWQGYAIDRLQGRWNALEASLIVGIVWAIWHVVPLAEAHRAPTWIAWQCLGMVPFRVLIVWIYNNTGRSVFATIVFQATANVSQFSFPNYGSHYDPFVVGLILAFAAATVVFLWGPETLARYGRFARSRSSDAKSEARGTEGR